MCIFLRVLVFEHLLQHYVLDLLLFLDLIQYYVLMYLLEYFHHKSAAVKRRDWEHVHEAQGCRDNGREEQEIQEARIQGAFRHNRNAHHRS